MLKNLILIVIDIIKIKIQYCERRRKKIVNRSNREENNPVSRSIWRRILQFQVLFVHERDSNRGVVDVSHVSPGTVSFVFLEQK